MHLAIEKSVADLFQKFSTRPPNKRGIHHQVLHEDEQYVYWGKPIFKGMIFFETRVVEELYKTEKEVLENELPIYHEAL